MNGEGQTTFHQFSKNLLTSCVLLVLFSHISHNGTQKINNNFWPRNKTNVGKMWGFSSCNSFLNRAGKSKLHSAVMEK